MLAPPWAHWIWFPEGDPTKDAPVAKRYFRKTFELPAGDASIERDLWMSADDRFVAYVNGERIGTHAGTGTFVSFDVSSMLKPGPNVIAVEAENMPAPVSANPAGLLAAVRIHTASGKELAFGSDASWRSAVSVGNDREWTSDGIRRQELEAGEGPREVRSSTVGQVLRSCKLWSVFDRHSGQDAQSSTRHSRGRCESRIWIADAKYRAKSFDPTSGDVKSLGDVGLDKEAGWTVRKPASIQSEDWVVVIERAD